MIRMMSSSSIPSSLILIVRYALFERAYAQRLFFMLTSLYFLLMFSAFLLPPSSACPRELEPEMVGDDDAVACTCAQQRGAPRSENSVVCA